jgi:hypothetical protein
MGGCPRNVRTEVEQALNAFSYASLRKLSWISWSLFLSPISFGGAKEMGSGFGVKLRGNLNLANLIFL